MKLGSLLCRLGVGAVVVVATASPVLAQSVVTACVTNSSGAVRVVFNGSLCKSNESPLSWNVAGQPGPPGPTGATGPAGLQGTPGDESVIAIGADDIKTTNSATVPSFGTIDIACASGKPSLVFTSADGYRGRDDVTTFNGSTQTSSFSVPSGLPTIYNTADAPSGKLVTAVIYKPGLGVWKLDVTLQPAQSAPFDKCSVMAVVTIAK
jgi:hypothetical protein